MAERGGISVFRILVLVPAVLVAQTGYEGCLPGADIRDRYRLLMAAPAPFDYSERSREAAYRNALELERQFPGDFFAQRAALAMAWRQATGVGGDPSRVAAEYERRLAQRPQDLAAQYFYAASLIGVNTPQAIEKLEVLAARHPRFAWPHLSLSLIFEFPAFQDRTRLEAAVRRFWDLCPDSLEIIRALPHLPKGPFQEEAAGRLRKLVNGRTDPEAVAAYPTLWTMEFQATPIAEHEPLRARVAADLKLLQGIEQEKGRTPGEEFALSLALRQGATLSQQAPLAKDYDKRLASLEPRANDPLRQIERELKRPSLEAPDSEQQAYWRKRLEAIDKALQSDAGHPELLRDRLNTLWQIESTTDVEILAAGDRFLKAAPQSTVRYPLGPEYSVAFYYVQRGIRLQEQIAVLEQAVQRSLPLPPVSDLLPSTTYERQINEAELLRFRATAYRMMAEAQLKLGNVSKARQAMDSADAVFEQISSSFRRIEEEIRKADESGRPMVEVKRRFQGRMTGPPSEEMSNLEMRGRIAQAEKRPADALELYRQAWTVTARFPAPARARFRRRLAGEARVAWISNGGSAEGWQAWLEKRAAEDPPAAKPAVSLDWRAIELRPQPMRLRSLDGSEAQLERLKGKVVFLNVWATWCAPCREELPFIEKLHQRVKDRSDIAVITLNVDDNIGLVQPFLRDKGFTFPVWLGGSMYEKLAPDTGIPVNWLADRNGVLRFEKVGFTASDDWVDQVLAKLDAMLAAGDR